MNSMNQIFLYGNAGKDAEVKQTQDGKKVARLSLATSSGGYKTKDGREVKEVTEWHTIICYEPTSSYAEKVVKGDKVIVTGRLTYRTYQGADGQQKMVAEIVAKELAIAPREKVQQPQPTPQPQPQRPTTNAYDELPF